MSYGVESIRIHMKLRLDKRAGSDNWYARLTLPIREKSLLTHGFVERKREEFEVLKSEIKALEEEAGLAAEATPAPRGGKQ